MIFVIYYINGFIYFNIYIYIKYLLWDKVGMYIVYTIYIIRVPWNFNGRLAGPTA